MNTFNRETYKKQYSKCTDEQKKDICRIIGFVDLRCNMNLKEEEALYYWLTFSSTIGRKWADTTLPTMLHFNSFLRQLIGGGC